MATENTEQSDFKAQSSLKEEHWNHSFGILLVQREKPAARLWCPVIIYVI